MKYGWDDQASEQAAADGEEAKALSGGRLGRQHRDGSNGTVRKQRIRGNLEAAGARAGDQLAAGLDYFFRRQEREELRFEQEFRDREAAQAARDGPGGAGGGASSASLRLDRVEAAVEDQNEKLDKLLELVGRSATQQPTHHFGAAGFHPSMFPG